MTSFRTYNKVCLFCRKDFTAQKRVTKFCSLSCASKSYKVNKKLQDFVEVNFEEHVKRNFQIQHNALIQIQITVSEILKHLNQTSQEYLNPIEYCTLNNISRKTLSRLIKNNKVEVKKITARKILIKK